MHKEAMTMRLFLLILIFIAILTFAVRYIETRGIFFPTRDIEWYPLDAKMPFEDIYAKTGDGITVNGWYIPRKGAAYTLLFFHGNAGNIQHRLDKLFMLWEAGLNIFIIDYRGFGKSGGAPAEEGFYRDADAAYGYLVNTRAINPGTIILYGESLGTAVAIELASRVKNAGVILEGAFSRGQDMARKIYPFFPPFIFAGKFDSLKKIEGAASPKLFIHGTNDKIVPVAFARKLYHSAPGMKEFVELAGGHNACFSDSADKYIAAITGFMRRIDESKDILPSH